jgi:peptidoglycan/LPS O-acetylase OafA/YrhL
VVVPLASPAGASVFSWETVLDNSWRFATLRGFHTPDAFINNPTPLAVNGSLWSIPFEFWCYIGVMLLGLCGFLKRRSLVLALLVISIITHFVVEWRGLTPGGKFLGVIFGYPKFWARLLPCYLAGTLLYLYRERVRLDWRWAIVALIGFLIAARVPHGLVFAIPTFAAYLLIYLAFTTVITWHRASAWGDFSYGVYLYAFPIQQLLMFTIGKPIAPVKLFLLSLTPTVLAGAASWHLIERWFLRPRQPKPRQGI